MSATASCVRRNSTARRAGAPVRGGRRAAGGAAVPEGRRGVSPSARHVPGLPQAGGAGPQRASRRARAAGSTFTRARSPRTCGSAISRASITLNHRGGT